MERGFAPEFHETVDDRKRDEVVGFFQLVGGEEEDGVVVERLETQLDAQVLLAVTQLAHAQVRLTREGRNCEGHSCKQSNM